MKQLNLITIITALLIIVGCNKQTTKENNELSGEGAQTEKSGLSCKPVMYSLAVDPISGNSFIYTVTGSPSAGPVTVKPYTVGGGTNLLIDCGTNLPLKFASGLAYDAGSGTFYGTTGASSPKPNHLFKFTNPNCVAMTPAVDLCGGLMMDLSDVERDPVTGDYYAINRNAVAFHKRIVRLGIPGGPTVICLAQTLPAASHPRGLTFDASGQLYVMNVLGPNGDIIYVNKFTGGKTAGPFAYPGPITPAPGVEIPEIGLHWDTACIKKFVTGNYDPIGKVPIMTDAALGGPYNFISGALRPTVDFARP